jgi:hypothetical protein
MMKMRIGFVFVIGAIALVSACTGSAPTRAELEARCAPGCAELDDLGCPTPNCVTQCESTAADAEREGCLIEAEAIMDCAEAQPDAVRCDQARTNAACIDEVNAFLNCQSAE